MIIFSAATAWVEAAAGIDLRTLFGRPGLYQPNLLTMTAGSTIAQFEAIREAATLTLLVAGQWNPETQAATVFGARNVMIADISEYKLEKARHCGVKNVVNPQEEGLGKAVLTTFGLNKADLILECVGTQDTITQVISNARKGATIVVGGVCGKKPEVDVGLEQDRELTLVGTLMYQQKDYERAIELVANGKLYLDQMITHRFAFKDYSQAYQAIEDSHRNYLRVMIDL